MDVEVEAKRMLETLLPRSGRVVIETYRQLRDELGRRPSPSEVLHRGALPMTVSAQYGSWFEFVDKEGDLDELEKRCLLRHRQWFRTLQSTALNFSYKMVAIRVLIDRDALWSGMDLLDFARACRDFILSHPTLKNDLPPTKEFPNPAKAPIEDWAKWWREWPMAKWTQAQNGSVWFAETDGRFHAAFACEEELVAALITMSGELVDYRIAHYSRTREMPIAPDAQVITAKVSHSGGNPILRFSTRATESDRPAGLVPVTLPNGDRWVFRFVKIACNVAMPERSSINSLPALLREWFGPDAGLPGTDRKVRFTRDASGNWSVEPVATAAASVRPPVAASNRPALSLSSLPTGARNDVPDTVKFSRFAPIYTLQAAAGGWGPDQQPAVAGWLELPGERLTKDHFIAHVSGHSMEPRIPDGSWCLFRRVRPGSRQGKLLLVQFRTQTDPETGGRFTVKRYHSEKQVEEEAWKHEKIQLRPLNPAYTPIEVSEDEAENMLVVGEFVSVLQPSSQP